MSKYDITIDSIDVLGWVYNDVKVKLTPEGTVEYGYIPGSGRMDGQSVAAEVINKQLNNIKTGN